MSNTVVTTKAQFAMYSDLHDSELTAFEFMVSRRVLKLEFVAEDFNTGDSVTLTLLCNEVTQFAVSSSDKSGDGFEDYLFPASALVDVAEIVVALSASHVSISGTYGWSINFRCNNMSLIRGASVKK